MDHTIVIIDTIYIDGSYMILVIDKIYVGGSYLIVIIDKIYIERLCGGKKFTKYNNLYLKSNDTF